MVNNNDGKTIFWMVDQIDIEDVHLQAQGYFGLEFIGNVKTELPYPLKLSSL